MAAEISSHFMGRKPSAIRQAQILFAQRPDKDQVRVVNLAIGNISLPMHPAMKKRMCELGGSDSPFKDGVVKYSASVGSEECQAAFLNAIGSANCDTSGLSCVVTDGGSQAMELMLIGVCGPQSPRPLLLLDPAYTNYIDMAKRIGTPTVSLCRTLSSEGVVSAPNIDALEVLIREQKPRGVVVIPADNPSGQFISHGDMVRVAKLCVAHDIWLISDEAYRQLHYTGGEATSVWRLTEEEVPGITGNRISIESSSKVWNACGLRIGALVTDNPELRAKAVAEYTANLCSNVIGQYIFGALAHESRADLDGWYAEQRAYYEDMMKQVTDELVERVPGLIVSRPDSAVYSIVDVREIAKPEFDAAAFVTACAKEGRVPLDGVDHTMLVAPMGGFYGSDEGKAQGRTQMRLAFVEPPSEMAKVARLFAALFETYG